MEIFRFKNTYFPKATKINKVNIINFMSQDSFYSAMLEKLDFDEKISVKMTPGYFSYVNPAVYLRLRKDPGLIRNIDKFFLDGILLTVIFKILGYKATRNSPDMVGYFLGLFSKAEKNNQKVFFIGSDSLSVIKAVEVIKHSFPNLNVVGYRDGFFMTDTEKNDTCNLLKKENVEVTIIGMGTPNQERFLNILKNSGYQGQAFTCGGFIHQTAKGIKYYPKWINELNLRWLYRFFDERRVFLRTLKTYPIFLLVFIYDVIIYKLN